MASDLALLDRYQEALDRAAEAEAALVKIRADWDELRRRVVARIRLAEAMGDRCVADEERQVLRLMDTLRRPCV